MTQTFEDTESLVIADILKRQKLGIAKYGRTLAQNPLELREWLQHSYEEQLDNALYTRRAIQQLDKIIAAQAINSVDLAAITKHVSDNLGPAFEKMFAQVQPNNQS